MRSKLVLCSLILTSLLTGCSTGFDVSETVESEICQIDENSNYLDRLWKDLESDEKSAYEDDGRVSVDTADLEEPIYYINKTFGNNVCIEYKDNTYKDMVSLRVSRFNDINEFSLSVDDYDLSIWSDSYKSYLCYNSSWYYSDIVSSIDNTQTISSLVNSESWDSIKYMYSSDNQYYLIKAVDEQDLSQGYWHRYDGSYIQIPEGNTVDNIDWNNQSTLVNGDITYVFYLNKETLLIDKFVTIKFEGDIIVESSVSQIDNLTVPVENKEPKYVNKDEFIALFLQYMTLVSEK